MYLLSLLIGFEGLQVREGKNSKSKSLHAPIADNSYDLVQKLLQQSIRLVMDSPNESLYGSDSYASTIKEIKYVFITVLPFLK